MASDSDLAALLPEPPPPRPAQRDSAIGAAMRRFDGHDDAPKASAGHSSERPWAWLARPQFASLAAMVFVVVLSSTVWLSQGERYLTPRPDLAAPDGVERPVPARPGAATPVPTESEQDPATIASPEKPTAPTPLAGLDQEVAAPSPELADEGIVVTGSRIQRPQYDSNSPMVSVDEAVLDRSSTASESRAAARSEDRPLGVLGGRSAPPPPSARVAPSPPPPARAAAPAREAASPDWAACTVSDPARNASACRRLADPAERSARGRAGAQLADGLARAWDGDLDRAITEFSRAISTAPDLSIAYLNRGLTYQAKGDLARAEADLDRAIDADPRAARGYYHRSQVRRARGDASGAEVDARRAVQLDSGYRAVLP